MDWKYLFTSFDGRINRKPYWLASLSLMAAFIILLLLFFVLGGIFGLFIGYVILAILIFYPSLALMVKRFHDRDKSGWWALVFYVPTLINGAISYSAPDSGISMVIGLITLGVTIWLLIELGILKGKPGSNDYGPNPLEP